MAAGASSGVVLAFAANSNAIKACGSIVEVDSRNFSKIVDTNPDSLYVSTLGGVFTTHYKYLTNYRGLNFYCKTKKPIHFPDSAEVIHAERMAIPDL